MRDSIIEHGAENLEDGGRVLPEDVQLEAIVDPDGHMISVRLAGLPPEYENGQITNCMVGFMHRFREDGTASAWVDEISIEPKYRGKGIGSRLYRAFTRLAVEHGATEVVGGPLTRQALEARFRVFGQDNARFYEYDGLEERINFDAELSAQDVEARLAAKDRFMAYDVALMQQHGIDYPGQLPEDARKKRREVYQGLPKEFCVIHDVSGWDISDWEPDLLFTTDDG